MLASSCTGAAGFCMSESLAIVTLRASHLLGAVRTCANAKGMADPAAIVAIQRLLWALSLTLAFALAFTFAERVQRVPADLRPRFVTRRLCVKAWLKSIVPG